MLFVRVVRKKLTEKKALLILEVSKINIYQKCFTCTSFCEFCENF